MTPSDVTACGEAYNLTHSPFVYRVEDLTLAAPLCLSVQLTFNVGSDKYFSFVASDRLRVQLSGDELTVVFDGVTAAYAVRRLNDTKFHNLHVCFGLAKEPVSVAFDCSDPELASGVQLIPAYNTTGELSEESDKAPFNVQVDLDVSVCFCKYVQAKVLMYYKEYKDIFIFIIIPYMHLILH